MMDSDGVCTNHEASIGCTSCQENERERIIQLLTKEYGEDYVDLGVVGQVVRLIKADPC